MPVEPAERPAWLPADVAPLVDALEAVDVRVAYDLRMVSPPLVLVVPTTWRHAGDCMSELDVLVLAIAPGPENGDAIKWLWERVAPLVLPYVPLLEAKDVDGYPGVQGTVSCTVPITN